MKNIKFISKPMLVDYGSLIKIGIAIYQMFAEGSSDNTTNLQVELLRNISHKIDLVNENIKILLKEVADLKKMIGELPQWIIEEDKGAEILSFIDTYKQRLIALTEEKNALIEKYPNKEIETTWIEYIKGESAKSKFLKAQSRLLESFLDRQKNSFIDISQRIENHRNLLSKSENYINVNILSLACYIEYDCLKNYLKRDQFMIITMLKEYITYFEKMLFSDNSFSLKSKIKIYENQRNQKIEEISNINSYHGIATSNQGTQAGALELYNIKLEENKSHPEYNNQLELYKNGVINKDDFFLMLIKGHSRQYLEGRAFLIENPKISRNGTYIGGGMISINFAQRRFNSNDINNTILDLQEDLELKTYRLISAKATYASGLRALNFCKFQLATI